MRRRVLMSIVIAGIIFMAFAADSTDKQYEFSFDYVNPESTEYPGGRGPHEMIVYTPEFGERTGTNEYGTEAVIENGVIIRHGSNDNEIPRNGYVLSAHGNAMVYILAFAREGRKAEIDFDNKTITVRYNRLDRVNRYRDKLKELQNYREEVSDHFSWFEMLGQQRQERKISRKLNGLERKILNNPDRAFGREFMELDFMLKEAWEELNVHVE